MRSLVATSPAASNFLSAGKQAAYLPDVEAIVSHVCARAQGGEIICVFSNGGFGGIHAKLLERLGKGS